MHAKTFDSEISSPCRAKKWNFWKIRLCLRFRKIESCGQQSYYKYALDFQGTLFSGGFWSNLEFYATKSTKIQEFQFQKERNFNSEIEKWKVKIFLFICITVHKNNFGNILIMVGHINDFLPSVTLAFPHFLGFIRSITSAGRTNFDFRIAHDDRLIVLLSR